MTLHYRYFRLLGHRHHRHHQDLLCQQLNLKLSRNLYRHRLSHLCLLNYCVKFCHENHHHHRRKLLKNH
jgi:hypothetical protein